MRRMWVRRISISGLSLCLILSLSSGDRFIRAAEAGAEIIAEDEFFEKEYLLPESADRYLEEKNLDGWSIKQLQYGRYEIYARHGMLFDMPEAAEYFAEKNWYFGFIKENDFSENMLNKYEISNIELLLRLENQAEKETELSTGTERLTETEEAEETEKQKEVSETMSEEAEDAEKTEDIETENIETEGAETEKTQEVSYNAGTYTAYVEGYSSDIMVSCTFDDTSIIAMGMNLSGETAGQGAEIGPEMIENILLAQSSEVDAISGATVTSNAITKAVADCIGQAWADEVETAIAETEAETVIAETEMETAIAETEAETVIAETEAETTIAETEAETAIAETEMETAIAETEMETTIAETEVETTIAETEAETTIAETEVKTEIIENEPEAETEIQFGRNEYIFPDVASRYLDRSEVARLSPQAVCYAKNEIYARHGRKFVSSELCDYFGSKNWYFGTVDPETFTDKVFNEYESQNLQLIIEYDTYCLDQPGYDVQRVNDELALFSAEVSEATISPEAEYLSDEWIFDESDIRYLTDEEVGTLSARVACYARYEIYARRGARFSSRELTEFFGNKGWYFGRVNADDFTNDMFNQYELYNIDLLYRRELEMDADGYQME